MGLISIWIPILGTITAILILLLPIFVSWKFYALIGSVSLWLIYLLFIGLENFINNLLSGDQNSIIIILLLTFLLIFFYKEMKKRR